MAQLATARRKFRFGLPLLLCSQFCSQISAQNVSQIQPDSFLSANDRFSMDLLKTAHEEEQDHNMVLAPLPVSLMFAALRDGTADIDSVKELTSAFRWEKSPGVNVAGRMLLARFEKPKPPPPSRFIPKNGLEKTYLRYLKSGKPEELWISEAFLYRGKGSLSPDFMDQVRYDFGFTFRAVDEHTPQSKVLAENWDPSLPMPAVTGLNDFWITSYTHLRTSWAGNTFVESKREKHDFRLRSGEIIQADFLKSEFEVYSYARTDEFEAIELSCWEASILLVLPAAESNVGKLEIALSTNPDLVEPLLAQREGDVQLPPFHFSYEPDLLNSLEKMGVHRIFKDANTLLSMAPAREGGVLRGVAQKTEITVDENGIRADAGTVIHGVYGGILAVQSPFHMALNRPFLFLIRDNVTHALLFAGVVMNPTIQ